MGRPVLKVKGYTPEEIRVLFRKDERYGIGIRLYAVYQVSLGQPSRNLEELYNTSFKQITNWVHRFEEEGIEGLKDKPGRGRHNRLSEEQRASLQKLLKTASPLDYGYNTATWTGPLLIDWIKNHYDVEYKKVQIYNIIRQLGFTYQRGKGIYPESSEVQQEEFKDILKKTSGRRY